MPACCASLNCRIQWPWPWGMPLPTHTSVETPGHWSTEWSKSEREKQILCVDAYIWNLGTSLVAQTVKNLPAVQETQVYPWVRNIPWRKEWQSTLVFLPEEFHGQRNLARYNPCGCKEPDMTDWATHTCTHTHTHTHTHTQRERESRKMILMNLFAKQHLRHRNIEQTCGHKRRMREWDKMRE